MDTQHFVVSIDEGSSQGVYCAYCGKKIVPARDTLSGSYIFHCDCEDAALEQNLLLSKSRAEQDLEHFLNEKTDEMQINELRTRIVVYEQHVHALKKRLQELMNKVAGVIAPTQLGSSTLVTKLPQEVEEVEELTDEAFPEDLPPLEEDDVEEYGLLEACHDLPPANAEMPTIDLAEEENVCSDGPFFDPREPADFDDLPSSL